jgi:hypothetical protein
MKSEQAVLPNPCLEEEEEEEEEEDNTAGKTIVLYVLILKTLWEKREEKIFWTEA